MGKGTVMKKITLLDGSAGTALWDMAEKAGVAKVPVWKYNIENPEFVLELHRRYVEAGSEMIQTNTFSINRFTVAQSSDYTVEQVVTAAVKLAKQATAGTGVKVYASFGPLPVLLEPYGKLTAAETHEAYEELVSCAVKAGVDCIVFETFMDVEMMRIAVTAAKQFDVPVICSMTFGKRCRTMMGDTVKKIADTLAPLGVEAMGMNCSFGPIQALEVVKQFHEASELPVYFKPNSGMGESYSAQQFAQEIAPALDMISYVGGCCGCNEEYIKEIKKIL